MTFVDFDYLLIFLPVVLILYYYFRTSPIANVVVLGASYYFYGSSGVFLLVPLMASSLVDFYVGHKLDESNNERHRKWLLIISIVVNMGILMFFKYATWAMESMNAIFAYFSISYAMKVVHIPMLPGVSFYTFQTMSYTIDIYRREMKASRHVINYMAFVTFWPHLVAGPIMRAKNLLAQIETIRPPITAAVARLAIMLIAWGLFKKIVLADNFGYFTEQLEGQAKAVPWAGAGLLFAYAFAGQIYCDFSAYTTIARGSAKLINIELTRNFLTPYYAATPTEFWRRWHISLSEWLRDYVYIPMGGNRHGKFIQLRNVMITMFLGGLWHGAGILFIAWGLWHGFLIVLYRLLPIERVFNKLGKVGRVLLVIIMFHLTCFGWLLFRAQPDTFMPLWNTIAGIGTMPWGGAYHYILGLAPLMLVMFATDYLGHRRGGEFEDMFARLKTPGMIAVLVFCYFAIVLLGKRAGSQFVYFAF